MSLKFVLPEKINFQNNILITGFHGIGTTGFIAMKYLINQTKAEKIGTIISDLLPPFITTKDEQISLPFELYKKDNYLMLIPHFQPYRQEHRVFSEELVNWTIENGFNKAILIGGLDSRLKKNDSDKIRVVATSKYLEQKDEKLPILEDGLFVTGPLAMMLTFYEIKKFPAIAILPYAENSRADPLAAANAIEKINSLTNFNVDISSLISDAELIEKNLEEIATQTKEQTESDKKEQGSKRLYI
jgi:uncharacterized protein